MTYSSKPLWRIQLFPSFLCGRIWLRTAEADRKWRREMPYDKCYAAGRGRGSVAFSNQGVWFPQIYLLYQPSVWYFFCYFSNNSASSDQTFTTSNARMELTSKSHKATSIIYIICLRGEFLINKSDSTVRQTMISQIRIDSARVCFLWFVNTV